jgi:hypothetical protein
MPGKRSSENGDFVSQRQIYRRDIEAVDSGGVTDDDIPELNTLSSDYGGQVVNNDVNMYGRNAQLDLSVITEVNVTLQVWMKAEIEIEELDYSEELGSSSSADPALTLPTSTSDWVLVEEKALTQSELWVVKDVPPGKFKVIATAHAGGGPVHILEQHAA